MAYVKTACSWERRCESQPMPRSAFSEPYAKMLANLITLRKERGVSQAELGSRIGKEQAFISRIERGERRIDVVEFYALAQALGVAPAEAYVAVTKGFPAKVVF